ncbi:histidine kinase [Clostridium sulfidigenes]|uniref:histidine kinase n=1 Tax=Clostridium sulfidigenes TaxID=318464 RepID=A0A084JEH3_9CLOT|nr:sensor histidine kinase [Clostridium sulfidigenes]KEZ87357.1 histidine kinase [Clostridium sulfidigenes]
MIKSKELLLMRYISFCILTFQVFIEVGNKSIVSLVFLLLFIINNHLRMFYLEKERSAILSIIIELVFIPLAQLNFGGTIIFYLIGVSIDLFPLKNKIVKYGLGLIILFFGIYPKFSGPIEDGIINFVLLGIFFILLSYISRLFSTKVEAQQLYDKLRVSDEKLIEANKELEGYVESIEELTLLKERNRISREIHDSVGHTLSTAMIQLSAMEAIAEKENSSMKDMIGNLRAFINESFQDVKRAVRELKPDEYDNYQGILRLQELCKNFERMSGVKVKVIISKGDWNLSTKQINHLYRMIQEILSNSLKHGKATMVKVIMNFTEDEFVISFSDNGVGTDKIVESGLGLRSIRERVTEIEGIVHMKSSKDNGFFVKVIVPREAEV